MDNKAEQIKNDFLSAYDAHSDAIFRYCLYRVGDHDKALDLMQEVYMKAWKYMRGSTEVKNLRAFLYKIAGNIVIDEYRKRRPQDSLEVLLEEHGFEPSTDEYDRALDKIDGQRAMSLLSELPEAYEEALRMRFLEDLSLSEISEITGENENTIAVRVHRGLAKLNKIFKTDQDEK